MSNDPQAIPSLFSQVDVSQAQPQALNSDEDHTELLREMLTAQDRTNELLEELIGTMSAANRQRGKELLQWKQANPVLANSCRKAAEALSRVQIEYLDRMTDEINENADEMIYGEFVFNEFVDRFGPRLAHMNGVIQTLAQLASPPDADVSGF